MAQLHKKSKKKNQLIRLGVYRHFKNKKLYRVLGVAKHSETFDDLVLYIPLYRGSAVKFWVRPLAMFFEQVEWEGKRQPRFIYSDHL